MNSSHITEIVDIIQCSLLTFNHFVDNVDALLGDLTITIGVCKGLILFRITIFHQFLKNFDIFLIDFIIVIGITKDLYFSCIGLFR